MSDQDVVSTSYFSVDNYKSSKFLDTTAQFLNMYCRKHLNSSSLLVLLSTLV